MTRPLRVGLIGLGGVARTHAQAWAHVPGAQIVAGSDVRPEVFPEWRRSFGLGTLTADPGEIFARPDIDVVDICAPNNLHAALAIGAMEAGKHVLCEKPLASSSAEIREIIAVRDRAGVVLMTGQSYRFSDSARVLRAEIDSGALGPVYHARAWWLRRAAVPVRPGLGHIRRELSGGGPVVDLGVHVLDLALWLMGGPRAVAVSAVARTELAHQPGAFSVWGPTGIPPEFDVEDFAAGFVRFDTGATLVLEVSWMLHHATEGDEDLQLWLYGTRGGAHWPSNTVSQTDYGSRRLDDRRLAVPGRAVHPHYREIAEFAAVVRAGGPSPVPAEDSLEVARILEAVYSSQRSGREVVIEPASSPSSSSAYESV